MIRVIKLVLLKWRNNILATFSRFRYIKDMAAKSKLSDQLRAAVRNSGKSVYRIAKDCGIAESHLHFFLNGQRGLGVDKIDRLAEYLQLQLRKKTSK
ncbi:hypothetical protein ACFL1G_06100 [Planctomycetota bacterium]